MKKFLRSTFAIMAVILCLLGTQYISNAAEVNLFYDFTNTYTTWTPLYGNAGFNQETEENGNRYLRVSYNNQANKDRQYFDVNATPNIESMTGSIQVDFDVKFSENESELTRNDEVQLKQRTGSGSNQTQIISRLARTGNNLQYQGRDGKINRLKNTNGNILEIQPDHWYSVKICVNMEEQLQSIFVLDRDSQNVLAYIQNIETITDMDSINMVTFLSGTSLCLDNVGIYNMNVSENFIYGPPYIKRGTTRQYDLFSKNDSGILSAKENVPFTWSLEKDIEGVFIDPITGEINVEPTAEPGRIILRAEIGGYIEARYIIEVLY